MITIRLTRGLVAIVDDVDAALAVHRWYALRRSDGRTFYAVRNSTKAGGKKSSTLYLHREIMNAPPEMQVDHRNGDGLDCRRDNMRLATHQTNQMNVRKLGKLKGVRKRDHRWQAYIKLDQRQRCLGRYDSAEDAARAYDAAAVELFGEFASLNYPP